MSAKTPPQRRKQKGDANTQAAPTKRNQGHPGAPAGRPGSAQSPKTAKPGPPAATSERNGGAPGAPGAAEKRISDFTANPLNPRKITDEQLEALRAAMAAYGDLSGLVVNLTTGHMVGGHQRVKILGDAPVEILHRFAVPTARGTVAEGVVHYNDERFVYREVQWDEATEKAAMVAANKHGGDWDIPGLSAMLMDLDASGYDLGLTGFSAKELESMLTKLVPDTEVETALVGISGDVLPAHVRMVQLFLTVETLPQFMEKVRLLGERFELTNITDTIVQAVAMCHARFYGDTETAPQVATDTERPAET